MFNNCPSGEYDILISGEERTVSCDMTTDGGKQFFYQKQNYIDHVYVKLFRVLHKNSKVTILVESINNLLE